MRKGFLILALGLFAAAGTAAADDLTVPDAGAAPAPDAPAPISLPAKGVTMNAVRKQFGEPRDKKGPVGGDTPKHPPITRWDYDNFVVIFEKDRVVDAVVPGAPPRLRSTAGLTPATDAPPAPSMPPPDQPPPAEAAPAEEPVIPEAPKEEPAPPMEPTAAAPAAESPPPDQPAEPPPAAEPQAQQMSPAPVEQPVPAQEYEDGPPTPKP